MWPVSLLKAVLCNRDLHQVHDLCYRLKEKVLKYEGDLSDADSRSQFVDLLYEGSISWLFEGPPCISSVVCLSMQAFFLKEYSKCLNSMSGSESLFTDKELGLEFGESVLNSLKRSEFLWVDKALDLLLLENSRDTASTSVCLTKVLILIVRLAKIFALELTHTSSFHIPIRESFISRISNSHDKICKGIISEKTSTTSRRKLLELIDFSVSACGDVLKGTLVTLYSLAKMYNSCDKFEYWLKDELNSKGYTEFIRSHDLIYSILDRETVKLAVDVALKLLNLCLAQRHHLILDPRLSEALEFVRKNVNCTLLIDIYYSHDDHLFGMLHSFLLCALKVWKINADFLDPQIVEMFSSSGDFNPDKMLEITCVLTPHPEDDTFFELCLNGNTYWLRYIMLYLKVANNSVKVSPMSLSRRMLLRLYAKLLKTYRHFPYNVKPLISQLRNYTASR